MRESLFEEVDKPSAEISPCGQYRYTLTRQWADGPCVGFLMFNPSTADATQDDPTIRRCIGFAKRWGYGRLVVLNLYAARSIDPTAIRRMGQSAIGPMNFYWLNQASKECREVVCAWGCAQHAPDIESRILSVMGELRERDVPLVCLGRRKDGHPRHPLMLAYDTPREPFVWERAA